MKEDEHVGASACGANSADERQSNVRGLSFAKGQSFDIMMNMLSTSPPPVFKIGSPVAIPELVFREMFTRGDVSSEFVINLALQFSIHPESVMLVGRAMLQQWKLGIPAIVFVSQKIQDVSMPMSHDVNSCRDSWICEFTKVVQYDPKVHVKSLECDVDFLGSDRCNYFTQMTEQLHPQEIRFTVVTIGDVKPPRFFKAFDQAFTDLISIDGQMMRDLQESLKDWMLPIVVHSMILHVANAVKMHQQALVNQEKRVTFHFPRESRLRTVTFKSQKLGFLFVRIDGPSIVTQKPPKPEIVACSHCHSGNSSIRCEHCGKIMYCQETCRNLHFQHQNSCEAYQQALAFSSTVPGGPMIKSNKSRNRGNKKKKKQQQKQQEQEQQKQKQ